MTDRNANFSHRTVHGRATRIFFILALALGALIEARSAAAQEKNLLWRVSDGKNSAFVLGSIHYLRKENYPLNKAILDALEVSNTLVLEIDLNATVASAAQRATLEKASYRDGSTLAQNVAPETYQLAAQRATELGLDMRILQPMKPWFVALTLVVIKLQSLGLDANAGVDRYLAERAKATGKPTRGLETLEFQIGLLDQLSKTDQELMLRETVRELDLLDKNFDDIVQSWRRGDAEALTALLLAGMKEYPEVYRKIIVERNRRWVPEIEKFVHQGGFMVTVGAAHLLGPDGVIEMLKAKGYSVEQK
jgi:uncharacterized protein YbaP (TraB family)